MKKIHALIIMLAIFAIGFWAGAMVVLWQHRFYPTHVNIGICQFDVINEKCSDLASPLLGQ